MSSTTDLTRDEMDLIDTTTDELLLPLDDVLAKLTDIEKKYCQIIVTQKPRSKSEALKRAGSEANPRYLSKMAWEIEQRPHVQAYMQHLRSIVVEEVGLSIQEIVSNARKGIEMAFEMGRPKEADPHNRLLAEIGGFIKGGAASSSTQVAVKVENTGSALKGDDLQRDFERLLAISGTQPE